MVIIIAKNERINNNLTGLALRLYLSLFEVEEGIAFYYKHYREESKEVALFILIEVLFSRECKDEIVNEIEKAIKLGIEPRESLINLLNNIKKTGELPDNMF